MIVQDHSLRPDFQFYTGVTGTGKTTLALTALKRSKARWRFVFDQKEGQIAKETGQPQIFDGDGILEATARCGYVCFNPMMLYPGNFRAGFQMFCKVVWEVTQNFTGKKLLFVDELQNVSSKFKVITEFQTLLDSGRTFGLSVIAISRRPNAIHTDTRSGFSHVYAFRQNDSNATEFHKEVGLDIDTIRNLRNGEYLWKNTDTGESGKGGKAF
jgi:hypothetical protein